HNQYRIGHVARIPALVFGDSQSSCRPNDALCSSSSDPTHSLPSNASRQWRVAYLITPAEEPQSVCMTPPPEEAHLPPSAIIIHSPHHKHQTAPHCPSDPGDISGLTEVLPEDVALYTMVIPGAVYNFGAGLIERSTEPNNSSTASILHSRHRWFNLACAK